MPPRHGYQSSVVHGTCQQGKCQGLESDSDRDQGLDVRGHKTSSSAADKRKALMKAIVRTTPTRAPSLLPETMQLSGSSATNKPGSMAQCQGAQAVYSQSTSVLEAMSSHSQKLPTGQSRGTGELVLPRPALSGLVARSRSDASSGRKSAESCKASIDGVAASGVQVGKDAAGTISGSAERRAVKRSLVSQPDFC